MIRFGFNQLNLATIHLLKCDSMLNHKNLSFKAAMRSLSDPAGYFPASKEIQGVSFNEVIYEDVQNKDVYIITLWYEFGEQSMCTFSRR